MKDCLLADKIFFKACEVEMFGKTCMTYLNY